MTVRVRWSKVELSEVLLKIIFCFRCGEGKPMRICFPADFFDKMKAVEFQQH